MRRVDDTLPLLCLCKDVQSVRDSEHVFTFNLFSLSRAYWDITLLNEGSNSIQEERR